MPKPQMRSLIMSWVSHRLNQDIAMSHEVDMRRLKNRVREWRRLSRDIEEYEAMRNPSKPDEEPSESRPISPLDLEI